MLKLFTEHVKGEEMYGLTIHAVMRITESVRKCRRCHYVFFSNDQNCLLGSFKKKEQTYGLTCTFKKFYSHVLGL